MIRTKDLVEFLTSMGLNLSIGEREYLMEIVARLRERDKLMEMPKNRAIAKRLSG